jgi:hypothetical protein
VIIVKRGNAGASIEELIDRYYGRYEDKLSAKAIYEYGKRQGKFAAWFMFRNGTDKILLQVDLLLLARYSETIIK